jgi:hypothetical protein
MKKHHRRQLLEQMLYRMVRAATGAETTGPSLAHLMIDMSLAAHLSGVVVGQTARSELEEWPESRVTAWQREATALLSEIVSSREKLAEARRSGRLQRVVDVLCNETAVVIERRFEFKPFTSGAEVLLDAQDMLRFFLVDLLRAAGTKRILRCRCERIFVKTGRRAYCSKKCQNRFYMQDVRRRDQEEADRGKTTRKR